jgi:NHLM bacteriocin system ABC transporter ATP-binding protein
MRTKLFTSSDLLIEAGANRSFLLDTGGIWYVEQGQVDLFCVQEGAEATTRSRAHIARVAAGQCLFSMAGIDACEQEAYPEGLDDDASREAELDGRLHAVGSAGTKLRFLTLADARGRFAAAAGNPEAGRLIEGWVESVLAGLTTGAMPRDCEALQPSAALTLDAGTTANVGAGVGWIGHREGRSSLLGRPELSLAGQPIPCSARAWFVVETSSVITMTSTGAMLEQGNAWTSLAAFQRLAVRCALLAMKERSAKELCRQQRRDVEREALMRDAFAELVSAHDAAPDAFAVRIGSGGATAPDEHDSLSSACSLIGAELGLVLGWGARRMASSSSDPVADIARASAVRVRRVLLEDGWWRNDSGPLLGRTGEKEQRWVALLPTPSGSYAVCDPANGSRRPVTGANASTLAPLAYTFYRSLPTVALSLGNVLRFGVHGCRRDLWLVVLLGLAGGGLALVTPVATGALFNSIIPGAERDQLVQVTLILLACACATGMFELVRRLALARVDGRMGAAVQAAVWDRLLGLPLRFFRPYSAGDLAVRAMGIDAMRKTLSGATVSAALGGIFSLFNFGLLFHYGGALAWWATLLLAIAGGATLLVGYGQLRLQRRIVPLRARTSGLVLQLLTGISKLRVAAAESYAFAQWARLFSLQRRLQFRARTVGNWLLVFNAVFPTLSLLVIMAAATRGGNAMAGIRTGDYLAFSAAFGACLAAMLSMSSAVLEALGVVPLYENAKPILEAVPEVHGAGGDPGTLAGSIEVHHLTFHYQQDLPPALQDVSFKVRPGEFVAFVGPSGSGKSTLLRVLLGFEEPDSGSVYFDGQDFSRLDVQAVRSQIGVVLQSGRIMAGDFFTNIVGSSAHTLEDAWEAARMAGLAEDIEAMPMGMHTVVSEGAGTLSGGQRQRLLIARAIVSRPRIVFFDEATSALDNRTQAIVSESLERLNATRIVIAHRLSTIRNASCLYVMERGRIVQSGRYDELIARDGQFADLARRQTN